MKYQKIESNSTLIKNLKFKKNLSLKGLICTGFALSDTKVCFVFGVTTKNQNTAVPLINLEGVFKATKCRIGPRNMSACAPIKRRE